MSLCGREGFLRSSSFCFHTVMETGKYLHVFRWACALLVVSGCGRHGSHTVPPPEELTLTSADGVTLAATLYPAGVPHAPGVILIPMRGTGRESWAPFALRAQRVGYVCLALDLRGQGDSVSKNGERINFTFTRDNWLGAVKDVETAKNALVDRGADSENIVLAGASIGANLVLHYALRDKNIAAIVLVSPGLDYSGVTTEKEIVSYGKRPTLLVAAQDDVYAAQTCATLKRMAQGLCELREYPGSAHGTDLFTGSTNAMEQILLWLKPIVSPNAK